STYTLLVLAAGLLARGRATGRDGLIRLLVAAGIMLAPQFGNATHLLLSQPDHLGTQLPLLLVFLLLDRAPRRWYVPVTAGIVLAFEGILNIYGGDFFHISQNSPFGPALGGLPVAAGVALAAVHLVGVALAAWGFFRAFRYFFDPGDLVSPVLATAIAVNVGAYSVSI